MSRKRRKSYDGCSIEHHQGELRLRFRAVLADGTRKRYARRTGLKDLPENYEALLPVAKLIGAALGAGKTMDEIDAILGSPPPREAVTAVATAAPSPAADGMTVAEYYKTWIKEQTPLVRKAQARDYRRHLVHHVLPTLGPIPLAQLRPMHIRGLQAELLAQTVKLRRGGEVITKTRSVKSVKNVISGSLRAMLGQAKADELLTRDVFAGLKWPSWDPPEPDPLNADERSRVLEWFAKRRFGLHPGKGSMQNRWVAHPAYYAYIHLLFWTGMRPSEASGLQWGDIDLRNQRLFVRRSWHSYVYNPTKVPQARRTVELFPETVRIMRDLQPLHTAPEMPVFTSLSGTPIEPKVISRYWYDCMRALGIRVRGIYCTKDTFVTTALGLGVKIPWLEAQTGVQYQTLRKHYGRWVPREDESELQRFAREAPNLFEKTELAPKITISRGQSDVSDRSYGGEKVRGGGLEPPRVLPH